MALWDRLPSWDDIVNALTIDDEHVGTFSLPLLPLTLAPRFGENLRDEGVVGGTAQTAKEVISSFLQFMDTGARWGSRPFGGLVAKQGIDPMALLPFVRNAEGNIVPGLAAPSLVNPGVGLMPEVFGGVLEKVNPELRQRLNLPSSELEDRVGDVNAERIQRARSYTDAFQMAMEGHPLAQIAFETQFDPLFWASLLFGGGEASLASRAGLLERLGPAAKALRTYGAADDFVSGLPIRLPYRAVETTLRRTGLLEKAPRGRLNEAMAALRNFLDQYESARRAGLVDDALTSDFDPTLIGQAPPPPPAVSQQATTQTRRVRLARQVAQQSGATAPQRAPVAQAVPTQQAPPTIAQPGPAAPAAQAAPPPPPGAAPAPPPPPPAGPPPGAAPAAAPQTPAQQAVARFVQQATAAPPSPAGVTNSEQIIRDFVQVMRGRSRRQQASYLAGLSEEQLRAAQGRVVEALESVEASLGFQPRTLAAVDRRLTEEIRRRMGMAPAPQAPARAAAEEVAEAAPPQVVEEAVPEQAVPAPAQAEEPLIRLPADVDPNVFARAVAEARSRGRKVTALGLSRTLKIPYDEAQRLAERVNNEVFGEARAAARVAAEAEPPASVVETEAPTPLVEEAAPPVGEVTPPQAAESARMVEVPRVEGDLLSQAEALVRERGRRVSPGTVSQALGIPFDEARPIAEEANRRVIGVPEGLAQYDEATEEVLRAEVPVEGRFEPQVDASGKVVTPNPIEDPQTAEMLRQSYNNNLKQIEHYFRRSDAEPPYPLPDEGEYFASFDDLVETWVKETREGNLGADPRWDWVDRRIQEALGVETGRPIKLGYFRQGSRASKQYNERLASEQQRGRLPFFDEPLGIVHPSWRKIFGRVQQNKQARDVAYETLREALDRGLPFTEAAANAWNQVRQLPEVKAVLDAYQRDQGTLELIRKAINTSFPQAQIPDLSQVSVEEFLRAVDQYAPAERKKVEKVFERWGMPGSTQALERMRASILEKAERRLAREFGVMKRQRGEIARSFAWLKRAVAEANLLTVRQVAQDVGDMSVKSVIEGVTPPSPGGADRMAGNLGIAVPSNVDVNELRRQTPYLEFSTRSVFRALGALGEPIARLSEARMALSRAVESRFRKAAWAVGVQRYLRREALPAFEQAFRETAQQAGIADNIVDNLFREVADVGTEKLSAERMRNLVLQHTGNADLAQKADMAWLRALNQASEEGVALANRIHFDYGDVRRIDELLGKVTLFHFWATRNLPYYAKTMADRPWMTRAIAHYQKVDQDLRERMGRSSRFANRLVETRLPLVSMLLGFDSDIFISPLALLSIFDQTQPRYIDQDQPALGQALDLLGQTGLMPAPWIGWLINVTGQQGQREPQRLVHQTSALADITGFDPERGIRNLVENVREAVSGVPAAETFTGSAALDRQIQRRIREMAMERGKLHDPLWESALGDPNSPIWKEAERQVRAQRIITDAIRFFLPLSFTTASEAEQQIQAAGAPIRGIDLSPEVRQQLLATRDPSTAYWGLPEDAREAQIRTAQAIVRVVGRDQLTNQTFVNQLAGLFPAWAEYEAWKVARLQQTPGANVTVDAFLGRLVSPEEAVTLREEVARAGWDQRRLATWLAEHGARSLTDLTPQEARLLREELAR